jgi:RND family efflux transporter MFP subunit
MLGAGLGGAIVVVLAMQLPFGGDLSDADLQVPYKEVTAERGSFRIAVKANGFVRPIDRIELKSKASGEVTALPIEVSDQIEEGALIAQLDQVEEKAALAQARADLDIARAELTRAQKSFERHDQLFGSKVISEELQDQAALDLAVARGKLVQATTALERAQEQMDDTVITAPVSGVILQKYVERGQIIASGVSNVGGGTSIADIADMRTVHIEAGIDEIDIGKIRVGQLATLHAEAYPEEIYEGNIVRIAPEARLEQNVTLFDVVIQVENTDGNLMSGMNATVEIVIADIKDVLMISVTALSTPTDGEKPKPGTASVLVNEEGEYIPRMIQVGRTNDRVIEILAGVEAGETLGIPMTSRLKKEHDIMDAKMRETRSFGGAKKKAKPSKGQQG